MKLTDKNGPSATCLRTPYREWSGIELQSPRGRPVTDGLSHSTGLSVSCWQISSERWSKASEEHNTKAVAAALSIRPGVTVLLHSPLRDNEDTAALHNWDVVHKQSRPALQRHQNTERRNTTCTKPCCYLLVALWTFRHEWTLQYRLSITYTVVYCSQFSFTFVRTN